MHSRTARLTICTIAWIAVGAAAFFVFQSEQQIAVRHAALRTFDVHAREAASAVADVRAAQQAYVAEGQGVDFWTAKVTSLLDAATAGLDGLRHATSSDAAAAGATDAAAAVAGFRTTDARARDFLASGEPLMAADVVFTEGGDHAATAARLIDQARLAEHGAFDTFEATERRLELYAVAGAGGLALLVMALLAVASPAAGAAAGAPASTVGDAARPLDLDEAAGSAHEGGLRLRGPIGSPGSVKAPAAPAIGTARGADLTSAPVLALRATADLCTDFGRVSDLQDLTALLARVADALEASGLVVWLRSATGDLRPVLGHGYPPQVLARMPPVARSADNAAAAAFRTGVLQIVLARPGAANGAIVAPLLSADGCIGALTAEIKGGGEASDQVQALAAIFAAQLVGVLAASASIASVEPEQRAANS